MCKKFAATLGVFLILLSEEPLLAQTFEVAGETLRYEDVGNGPPLVLISGWAQSLNTWDFQAPTLAQQFRVIRYDRGSWGAQMDPTPLLTLLDSLDLEQVSLVGHSMGAGTALRFAANFPQRVTALVVIGPPGAPGIGPWNDDQSWEAHLKRLKVEPPDPFIIANEYGVDSLMTLALSHPLFAMPEEASEARTLLELNWAQYDGSDLTGGEKAARTQPVTEGMLRTLKVPTLVIVGDQEVKYIRRAAERLDELIPDSELLVLEGGGHMIQFLQPDAVNQALLTFLGRH